MVALRAIEQNKGLDDEFLQKILLAPTILAAYIQPEEFMQGETEKGRFDIFMKCFIPMSQQRLSESDTTCDEEFIVVVENKVSAKETKGKSGRGQTAKYKEYLEANYKGKNKLMILLSPDRETAVAEGKGVKIDCEDFIRVSYQDLLTLVIEPILNSDDINREDEMRLKDYIKCLSIPALEDDSNNNNSNKKSIIMAMSAKETKLLMDFWNNNEDLIKACLSAIASNDEFSDDVREIASKASTANFTRDTSKYSFKKNNGEKWSRSGIVPAFIARWANKNEIGNLPQNEAFDRLTEAFPATLRGGKRSTEGIIYSTRPESDYADRNFPPIEVGAYTFYVAANIWTKERFAIFMDLATKLAENDPNLVIVPA